VNNSDARRGKSGGYRVIYYIQTSEAILLTNIYSKSDRANIGNEEIEDIIDRYIVELDRLGGELRARQEKEVAIEPTSSLPISRSRSITTCQKTNIETDRYYNSRSIAKANPALIKGTERLSNPHWAIDSTAVATIATGMPTSHVCHRLPCTLSNTIETIA
jgi:hypothetical protein